MVLIIRTGTTFLFYLSEILLIDLLYVQLLFSLDSFMHRQSFLLSLIISHHFIEFGVQINWLRSWNIMRYVWTDEWTNYNRCLDINSDQLSQLVIMVLVICFIQRILWNGRSAVANAICYFNVLKSILEVIGNISWCCRDTKNMAWIV